MRYALLTVAALALGGCASTTQHHGWTPTYEQPGGLRHDAPYYHNGTDVSTLGDYGRRAGSCTSNGLAIQWDINWERP